MAVNKRKILEVARKHAQKGAKQKALKEYSRLLKRDPRDAKLRLEIGDAHRRWGEVEEAVGHYTKVADQYQQDGFDARAVAVYKQILNLDPKRYGAYVSLSQLYQRMGLDSEAIAALQTAADGFHKEGKKREALELLRKMAAIDPSNTTSRTKVAELLKQEGLKDDAVAEYEEVASELLRQGATDQVEAIYLRVLELRPRRADILLKLGRNCVELRVPERAESYAKRAVDLMPDDAEPLELLCDVYKAIERTDGLIEATRKLAKLYRARGDDDQARTIMQRLPVANGFDSASKSTAPGFDATEEAQLEEDEPLGEDAFLDDGTDVFDLEDEAPIDEDLQLDAPASADDLLDEELSVDEVGAAEEEADDEAPAEPPDGEPDQLIAEASVYLRYGKRDQALANLEAVIAREPGHRAGLEKLGEAYAEDGENERAVGLWSLAAERAHEEGDGSSVDVLCGRVAALDPGAAVELSKRFGAADDDADDDSIDNDLPDALEEKDEHAGSEPTAEEDEIEIDIDLDDELAVEEDDAAQASATLAAGGSSQSATSSQQIQEELVEAEFYSEQGLYDEAEEIYQRVLELAPNHPSALLRLGEIGAARGEDPAAVVEESGTGEEADAGSSAPFSEAADDLSEPTLDALGEVDDEEPSEPPAVPVDDTVPMEEPVAAAEAEDEDEVEEDAEQYEGGGFDLAAELGLETGPGASGSTTAGEEAFASIFSDFKKGVSETLGKGDFETRFDLAIAYKEMGLFDDAVEQFQVCLGSESRALDSLQMMAACALDLGRASDAVGHLEQALAQEALTPERRAGLSFDLGRACAAVGDVERARSAFEAAREHDSGFPGIDEQLAELEEISAGADDAEDDAAADEAEEVFESFDDLIAEAEAETAITQAGASRAQADEPEQSFESFDDVLSEAEEALDASDSAAEAVAEPEPDEPSAGKRKRKKKISFV